MKYTEITEKTTEELQKILKEKRTQLFTLKTKLKTMQLTNTSEIKTVRQEIAQVLTAINAKRDS